jgi:geranylgeranyl diphosphate synthase type II
MTDDALAGSSPPGGGLPGRLGVLARAVDARLPALIPAAHLRPEQVHRATHYALTSPGKRLRPVLTMVAGEIFGAPPGPALDLGCAVEMVHACSLILDDLPAMDDASLRRGRATVHRAFGEDIALLAAFALLNRAFSLTVEVAEKLKLRRYGSEDMVHHLAASIGTEGLIGGQALDLEGRAEELDLERLEYIHSHKTGALFIAAGELGAMAADARRRDLEVVTRFAKNLGLAFQICDDLLDVLASPEQTGKDSGQDAGKQTFVTLLGVAGARTLASELLGFASESLAPLGRKGAALGEIAQVVGQLAARAGAAPAGASPGAS